MSAGLCFRAALRETTPTVPSPLAGYSSSIDGNDEVTRAGITFQRAAASAGSTSTSVAWSSGDATDFDGNYLGLTATEVARFRLVLPGGAGNYVLRVAHTLRSYLRSRVRIYDTDGSATLGSGTLLATSDASTATIDGDEPSDQGRYIDAAGTLRDFTVALASSTPTSPFAVSGTHVWVEIGTIAGSLSAQVAALSLETAGPQITAPVASASLTVEQGGSLSVSLAIARNGNTNALTMRTQSGTPPTGVSMDDVVIANPATTGTGTLAATGSAPLVTNDPMVLELVDGSTVVATVAVTVTVTAPTAGGGPGAGGAANAVTEQDNGVVLLSLYDETGDPLTTSTATIRVAGVASDTFADRSATYRGEPGQYVYTLTTGERASRGMATIVLPNGETMHVAVVEPGTMFSAMSTLTELLSSALRGVAAPLVSSPFLKTDQRWYLPLWNDFTLRLPRALFPLDATVTAKFCATEPGNPNAIDAAVSITLAVSGSDVVGTIDRAALNTHLTTYNTRDVFLHVDDGVSYHAVQRMTVSLTRPLWLT